MPMSAARVEEALLALDRRDDAAVVHRGLQTLDPRSDEAPSEEADAAWRDELSRRVDEIESGEVQPLARDEVFGHARAAISASN